MLKHLHILVCVFFVYLHAFVSKKVRIQSINIHILPCRYFLILKKIHAQLSRVSFYIEDIMEYPQYSFDIKVHL